MPNMKAAAIAVALSACAITPGHANLVQDSSFATGIGSPWISNASSAGTSWFAGSGVATQGCTDFSSGQCTSTSDVAASNYLAQTISGLTVGSYYALSFAYADGATTFGLPTALVVLWGSNVVGDDPGATVFDETDPTLTVGFSDYAVDDLLATSTTMQIAFLGEQNNAFAELTNVALNAVPEPASLSLFSIALGGLGFIRRQKSKRITKRG
jgi:hypothetical protein